MVVEFSNLCNDIQAKLQLAGCLAEKEGVDVYLVGGTVRDLMLNRHITDIDLVVQGDGLSFAKRLAQELKGYYIPHSNFLTATIKMPDGNIFDIATARSEIYEKPSTLPRVKPASLRTDLKRRDFTINAMAIALNAKCYGKLIDPFEGRKDLDGCIVRIINMRSFIDDPTRIFRAIRFEQRLQFKIEFETRALLDDAVEKKMIGELSGARILEQLKLICLEVDPWLSFRRLEELKVFQGINSNIVIDKNLKLLISQVCKFKKIGFSKKENGWVLVLIALLKPWKVDILKVILDHLNPSRRIRKAIEDMPRWKTVEKAIKTGEIKTPAEFFHRVRAISEITILFVSLTNNDNTIRKRCELYYHNHRNLQLSVNGEVLRELNIPEGPVYKKILDEVLSMKINGDVRSDYDEYTAVQNIWARRKKQKQN